MRCPPSWPVRLRSRRWWGLACSSCQPWPGDPGTGNGAAGVSRSGCWPLRSPALFLTRTDLPDSGWCGACGKQGEEGVLPFPSQGQLLPPSGLSPHLPKGELQVPCWGWGRRSWLRKGISEAALKGGASLQGAGVGLARAAAGLASHHPLPPGGRG